MSPSSGSDNAVHVPSSDIQMYGLGAAGPQSFPKNSLHGALQIQIITF